MSEDQIIEYKSTWRDEFLKWICGYANAQGGTLFIGIEDGGEVVGIKNAGKLLEDIPNKVRDGLGIMVDVNRLYNGETEYLEILVDAYPYPVSYHGNYYYRSGSTKQELKGAALDRFLLNKQGVHWDSAPVIQVHSEDFDKNAVDNFRQKARNTKRISETVLKEDQVVLFDKLHLVTGNYYKRAAIVLFHPDPEQYIGGSGLKIGYFRSDAELVFQDEIHGPLFSLIEKTMDLLLTKYLPARISYSGIQRIERYPVPEAALREMLMNAVCHRDFSVSVPVQISVYSDKIMCWNPGTLPEGLSAETLLRKHSSQPSNPLIAGVLFSAGMLEAWGRGFEKIAESCRDVTGVSFEIRPEPSGFWLIFYFQPHEEKVLTESASVKTSVETSGTTMEWIIRLMKENPSITLSEIAQRIEKSVRAIEMAAAKLRDGGKIRYTGPKKGGKWEVLP